MSEEISREDMGDKLLDATRNNYKAQIKLHSEVTAEINLEVVSY